MLQVSDILKIILVVDESRERLHALRDMLEDSRRMVITMKSGREALQLVRLGMQVDAAVISDELSDIESFQMLIDLKRAAPSVPVIMMLTPGPDAESLKGLSPGIFEYVEKPVRESELKRTVDIMLKNAIARSGRPRIKPDIRPGQGPSL